MFVRKVISGLVLLLKKIVINRNAIQVQLVFLFKVIFQMQLSLDCSGLVLSTLIWCYFTATPNSI